MVVCGYVQQNTQRKYWKSMQHVQVKNTSMWHCLPLQKEKGKICWCAGEKFWEAQAFILIRGGTCLGGTSPFLPSFKICFSTTCLHTPALSAHYLHLPYTHTPCCCLWTSHPYRQVFCLILRLSLKREGDVPTPCLLPADLLGLFRLHAHSFSL